MEARRPQRKQRIPLHEQRDLLNIEGKEDGFVYRWVNDVEDGNRVEKFKQAGYEVAPKHSISGGVVEDDKFALDKTSTVNKKHVGGGVHAILMRQRVEWYEEDQRAKQKSVDDLEATMRQNALQNFGEIKNPKADIISNKKK